MCDVRNEHNPHPKFDSVISLGCFKSEIRVDKSRPREIILLVIASIHIIKQLIMLRTALRPVSRSFASTSLQSRFASSLVYLEHKNGKLNDSSLSAVTAAKKVDGNVSLHALKCSTVRMRLILGCRNLSRH